MVIKGIEIKKEENCLVCYIDKFSEEIKKIIKSKLTKICYGSEQIDETQFYSYKNTIKHFYEIYEKKSEEQKKGLMGELLTHILFDEILTNFKVVSVFFNKEEKSARKGFDLIFIDLDDNSPWYSEVKSGSCNGDCVTDKTIYLLKRAKNDIKSKFNSGNNYLWISVLTDLNSTFKEGSVKKELKKLLQLDATNMGKLKTQDKRVVVVSVVYEPLTKKIDFEKVKLRKTDIEDKKLFSKIILFSIQKETYTKIEDFLFKEIRDIK